jgi:hypothetical protein
MLDHLLPSVQLQSFSESTCTSFEHSLTEFYTILLEEHVEDGNLFIVLVPKTDQHSSVVFRWGDCAQLQ